MLVWDRTYVPGIPVHDVPLSPSLDIAKEGLNDDTDEDHQHKRGANHPLEVLR